MDQIINHAVLSLDFWQDTVTYEGCTMPTGTIGFLSKSWQPSFPKNTWRTPKPIYSSPSKSS